MGVRFSSSFGLTNGAATGANGNQIIASTANIIQSLAGQAVALIFELEYTDGATPINPNVQIVRGLTTAGTVIYATGNLGAGTTGVVRRVSGVFVDVFSAEISTPYSLMINNTNAGTSVAITTVCIAAIGL